ncbi:hypothetical protein GNX60_07255 [Staphylococcus sp. 170179]|nr:hypothetical protein [Staphylococcus borealis]
MKPFFIDENYFEYEYDQLLKEIDYLNGQIVEYGKSLGIATPNNELITHIIHQLEMKLNINEY